MSATPNGLRATASLQPAVRNLYAIVLITSLTIGVGASIWSRTQLKTFQMREGLPSTWSLFSRPTGADYRFWGTTVPFVTASTPLVVLGAIVTRVAVRRRVGRRHLIALWSILVVVGLGVFIYVMFYLGLLASDFFI